MKILGHTGCLKTHKAALFRNPHGSNFIAFLSMSHVQGAFQRIRPGGVRAKVCVVHFCPVERNLQKEKAE
ncbi:hypothetical protein R3I93_021501 [Phoxinus phoxinus]|uniref:Uncharacterized protein n=1 Tax=Phoxinus phoxinus TaxID=58324 RepID=A0AAN9GSW3_9TELE